MPGPYPTELRRLADTGLLVVWSDGQRREYTSAELRAACPCAGCRETRAGREPEHEPVDPQPTVPIQLTKMRPIGNYAYGIAFSDGHETGIYTFELLRELGREV